MKWLIAIAVLGCGPGKPPAETGSATTASSGSTACDGTRGKVEQLYRAEAKTREPKRVAEAVADNTAMVMNDCAKAPAKVAACIAAIGTVAELEAKCLVALDDEGTEGEQLAR
jgi:hypothetical protein